jgi:hypothetical protein
MLTRADIADLRRAIAPVAPADNLVAPDDDIPPPTGLADYGLSADAGQDTETEIEPNAEKPNATSIIKASPFIWRAPAAIPPRDWLYGRHYVRSFITATIAPGGLGKTSLALVEAIAMATGRPLLGYPVRHPLRVWYYGGEDPLDEIERRLAAICSHYDISPDDWRGRLFVNSGRETPIRIAEMGRQQNVLINEAAITAIVEELRDPDERHIHDLRRGWLVDNDGEAGSLVRRRCQMLLRRFGEAFQCLDGCDAGHVVRALLSDGVKAVGVPGAQRRPECRQFGVVVRQHVRLAQRKPEAAVDHAGLGGGIGARQALPDHRFDRDLELAGDAVARTAAFDRCRLARGERGGERILIHGELSAWPAPDRR